jgi:hypothetical protein
VDQETLERAHKRLADAAAGRTEPAEVDAALERARQGIEGLAAAVSELEAGLADRVAAAVREGFAAEARPVGRQVAEVRGLMNQVVRRLERIEGDVLAERNARVDDLALLIDLVTSGWSTVDARLAKLEQHVVEGSGAVVYRIEDRIDERRPANSS